MKTLLLIFLSITAYAQHVDTKDMKWTMRNGTMDVWHPKYGWSSGWQDEPTKERPLPVVEWVDMPEDSVPSGKLEGVYKSTSGCMRLGVKGGKAVVLADCEHWKKGEVKAYIDDAGLSIYPTVLYDRLKGRHDVMGLLEDRILKMGKEEYLKIR